MFLFPNKPHLHAVYTCSTPVLQSRAVDSNRVYSPARGSVVNLMATHLISEMFQSEPMWKNDRHAINMCFPCANKVNLCLPGIKTCGTSIFQP